MILMYLCNLSCTFFISLAFDWQILRIGTLRYLVLGSARPLLTWFCVISVLFTTYTLQKDTIIFSCFTSQNIRTNKKKTTSYLTLEIDCAIISYNKHDHRFYLLFFGSLLPERRIWIENIKMKSIQRCKQIITRMHETNVSFAWNTVKSMCHGMWMAYEQHVDVIIGLENKIGVNLLLTSTRYATH